MVWMIILSGIILKKMKKFHTIKGVNTFLLNIIISILNEKMCNTKSEFYVKRWK